ncbi:hypothetical protein ES708_09076 [subsurface metagenome]
MPEVMTEEYCRQCPWFMKELGWLDNADPYWQDHDSKCMCKDCPNRQRCESQGAEQDILVCFEANRAVLEKNLETTMDVVP